MTTNCAACLKEVKSTAKMLKCSKCEGSYHELCAGISIKDMSIAQKSAWACPKCYKRPKGDNDNTPVRKDSGPTDNITVRKPLPLTREDISEIVRHEIRSAIKESVTDIIKTELRGIKEKICDLETSVTFISEQYEDFKRDITYVKPQIQALAEENTQLKSTVSQLCTRLNQMEQLTRASNIEVQCVPEHAGENLPLLVQQLGTVIEHPVQNSEIIQCSRIAKLNPNNPRPRSILVKFSSPRITDSFLAASRNYNKRHVNEKLNSCHLGIADENKPSIYVAEHLSKETKALHTAARLRAREIGYKFVWVKHGRVYLRKSEGMQHEWVKDMEVLNNIK